MATQAVQDLCHPAIAQCWCCGRDNPRGLRIKTHWDGEKGVCRFTPQPHHLGYDGLLYGGIIAGLIDCHAMGAAVAATCQAEGRAIDSQPPMLYLTANLNVDYLKPTPLAAQLELVARVEELKGRKAVVAVEVRADGVLCARGRVIGVRAPM